MLDYRIVDHGQRVAYIMHHLLAQDVRYSDNERGKICLLCGFHDIGAYKTEDIDTLTLINAQLNFEVKSTIRHSVYGFLFLRNFSILGEYADAVLFHHFRYDEIQKSDCKNKDIAAKLLLADRIDSILTADSAEINANFFSKQRDTVFFGNDIDIFLEAEERYNITEKLQSGEYLEEYLAICENISLTQDELHGFYTMLSFFIDFRSEYTVLHNIATIRFSVEIARLMELNESDSEKIYYGAMLHDVGKITASVMVLEKSERLDDFEYNMIKDHVLAGEVILKGCVDDDVLEIAIRHHEKLNGSGYPRGLTAKDLTTNQRIVCVADILSALYGKRSYKDSFPREKIISLIKGMSDNGQLSKEIVDIVIANYDKLTSRVDERSRDAVELYTRMHSEYAELCKKYSQGVE